MSAVARRSRLPWLVRWHVAHKPGEQSLIPQMHIETEAGNQLHTAPWPLGGLGPCLYSSCPLPTITIIVIIVVVVDFFLLLSFKAKVWLVDCLV